MPDDGTVATSRQEAMREALAELTGQEPADGDLHPQEPDADSEERKAAISEILAELRGEAPDEDASPEPAPPTPADTEPDSEPEAPQTPEPEPSSVEQEEDSEPAVGTPAGGPPDLPASPAPRQRLAREADRRPSPQASTPRNLILLHALFVGLFSTLAWLGYRQMASTLGAVRDGLRHGSPAAAQGAGDPAQAALPGAQSPSVGQAPAAVLQVDEGLRYVQEMEKADLLFEQGTYRAAAAAYGRAVEIVPPSWDDGAAAFRLGECYFRLGDHPRAISAYERVAAAYPSGFQPRALFQLGEAHLRLKAYGKARDAFHDLLLRQGHWGADAAAHIQKAYYRIADCYRLEAEALAEAGRRAAP